VIAIGTIGRSIAVGAALAAPASALPAQSTEDIADIFIGTPERDGNNVVLQRCDLVNNRYVLVDAPGAHAVEPVRKAKVPAYGEVIAQYAEMGGRSVLRVERVKKLTSGQSCHLLDALGKAR
jgi:hypothetical protein